MNEDDRELLDKMVEKTYTLSMDEETRQKVANEVERIFSSKSDGIAWIIAVLVVARCLTEEIEEINKMMEEYHENN